LIGRWLLDKMGIKEKFIRDVVDEVLKKKVLNKRKEIKHRIDLLEDLKLESEMDWNSKKWEQAHNQQTEFKIIMMYLEGEFLK